MIFQSFFTSRLKHLALAIVIQFLLIATSRAIQDTATEYCITTLARFLEGNNEPSIKYPHILQVDAGREVLLLSPKQAVYYEPIAVQPYRVAKNHSATLEIGSGVVTLIFSDGSPHRIFLHTKRDLDEISKMYPSEVIAAMKGLSPGQRLLDLGCGTGQCVLDLRDEEVEAHGIDVYIPLLHRQSSFLHMRNFNDNTFPDNYFDLIVATLSLIRGPIVTTEDKRIILTPEGPGAYLDSQLYGMSPGWEPEFQVLSELERVLKKNGKVYFIPLSEHAYNNELGPHFDKYRANGGKLKLLPVNSDHNVLGVQGLHYGTIVKE